MAPKPDPKPPLDQQIAFRCSSDDLAAWQACGERAGLPMHTWMRRKLRQAVADANRKR